MRSVLMFCLALLPASAQALCRGQGVLSQLTPPELAEIETRAADTPNGEGLIWTAQKDGTVLTLIGTIHVPDPRLAPVVTRAAAAVRTADLLLVEANSEDQAKVQNALVTEPERLFITDGPTLPELLPQETWDQVRTAANSRSIPAPFASKMQPWFLSISLALPPCTMTELVAGEQGVDGQLIAMAEGAGIPVLSLEPWDTVFSLFENDPLDEQIRFLKTAIAGTDLVEASFVTLMNTYVDEKTAYGWEMSRIVNRRIPGMSAEEADQAFEEMSHDLLTARNTIWMDEIALAAQAMDKITIAVGAAHLPGEHGLLHLLEQSGWQVSRSLSDLR